MSRIISTDLADKIVEILVENLKRNPHDRIFASHSRDVHHLNLAARKAGYGLKEDDFSLVMSEVNLALDRYILKVNVTHKPRIPDMRGGKYLLPENKRYT